MAFPEPPPSGAEDNALDFVDAAVALALEDLADGTDLQGLYPEQLYSGAGGVLQDFRDDLFAAVAKTQGAMLKRLAIGVF